MQIDSQLNRFRLYRNARRDYAAGGNKNLDSGRSYRHTKWVQRSGIKGTECAEPVLQ